MANTQSINVERILGPFKKPLGVLFDKTVADIKSALGNLDKDIMSKGKDWKVGAAGKLKTTEGHTLQLPLNASWAILLQFAMRLDEVSTPGDIQPECNELPKLCRDWHRQKLAEHNNKPAKTEAKA